MHQKWKADACFPVTAAYIHTCMPPAIVVLRSCLLVLATLIPVFVQFTASYSKVFTTSAQFSAMTCAAAELANSHTTLD